MIKSDLMAGPTRFIIRLWVALNLFSLIPPACADVRVFVQGSNGLAFVNYQSSGGEVVRAFALDVTVDRGQILGVTNYFRGPCTATAQGYGIFPASFRDNVTVVSGSNANWSVPAYSPLAVVADNPAGTLPGLNSAGVTLEFAALWDASIAAAFPPSQGTLCALQLSQTATVSIAANASRGAILASPTELPLTTHFTGALVGPAITGATATNGVVTVVFQGGELETAPTVSGPWTGTGMRNGAYTETPGTNVERFFRVRYH